MSDKKLQPGPTSSDRKSGRGQSLTSFFGTSWFVWGAVFIITLVHCIKLIVFFGGPKAVASDEPLLYYDHSFHFFSTIISSRFLAERGTTWGYNPFLMAGFPTDVCDSGDRLLKVGMLLMSQFPVSHEASYKILVLLEMTFVPLLFFATALLFGMGKRAAILSVIIGIWVWGTGGGFEMFKIGMVGWSLASIYGLAFVALFMRFLQTPSWAYHVALLVAAPLALLIHPLIVIVVFIPAPVIYLQYFSTLPVKKHLFIVLVCAFTIVCNLFWVIPLFVNMAFVQISHFHLQSPLLIIQTVIQPEILDKYQMILPMLPLAAYAGFCAFRREDRRVLVPSLAITITILAVIFFAGSFDNFLKYIEPGRYGVPLFYLLVFPATRGIMRWGSIVIENSVKWRLRIGAAIPLLILIPSFILFLVRPYSQDLDHPFLGINPRTAAVRDWIIENTDRSARILLENSGPYSDIFGRTYSAFPISYYTKRELIGGPHWGTPLQHHYVYLDGLVFIDRHLSLWNANSLGEYMVLYNVGWVGAYSPQVRALFDRYPSIFRPLGEAGGFRFYLVGQKRSFFIEGSGQVESDYNRLELTNVSTTTGRVILSYHWDPRFTVPAPARITRVMIGDDPVGFIGITNPASEMRVEIRRGLGSEFLVPGSLEQ